MTLVASAHTASSLHPILLTEPSGPPLSMTLPSIAHDNVPLTDAIVCEKGTYVILCYHVLGNMSNCPCPVTRTILECLGISIYTFQQRVPIINERNSVGMWKEVLLA